MRKIYFISLIIFLFYSCSKSTSNQNTDILIAADTLYLPVPDDTYVQSKSLFAYEKGEEEFLVFQNDTKRGGPFFLTYDINTGTIIKRTDFEKEGANGVIRPSGVIRVADDRYIVTSLAGGVYLVNDEGEVLKRQYFFSKEDMDAYPISTYRSYLYAPLLMKDSLFLFHLNGAGFPHQKEDWKTTPLFAHFDLSTGEKGYEEFFYPDLFSQDEILNICSYDSDFSYDSDGRSIAVSLMMSDSIYVWDKQNTVKAYNAKSRYFPNIHPTTYNVSLGLADWTREERNKPRYWHLIYDKYRKVYYRFAIMPYEIPQDVAPLGIQWGEEFSIVVLNDHFEVIGETRFPGNTYVYQMCFVGKKGLYISLNNQKNPINSDDCLCFQLLELKLNK